MTTAQQIRRRCWIVLGAVLFLCGFTLSDTEVAILQKDYSRSENLAQALLKQDPPLSEAHKTQYYLGLSYLGSGQYGKALDAFEELIRKSPEPNLRDRAFLGVLDAYFLNNEYEKAADTGEKLLKLNPNSDFLSLTYMKTARANFKLADWQKATRYLNRIVEDFPGSPEMPVAKQFLEEKQYFAVQVGAFLDRQRSEELATELKDKGEYAYVVETVDPQGKKFYRVRVGKLALLEEAESLQTRLSKLGYPTAIYP